MSAKRALIVGIGGQDGSLLAELLLEKGYRVFGLVRGTRRYANLDPLEGRIDVLHADVCDTSSVVSVLEHCQPDEVYNLASISFSPASWNAPTVTSESDASGATALLESIRRVGTEIRFFQASSSEIFGTPSESPQSETTPVAPLTPYGASKAYAHFMTRIYRHRYGLYAAAGILYNHESERRPLHFLARKVAHGAAAISLGLEHELSLGDLDARRDWGYARDYVCAMWLMLQRETAEDFVVATGVAHTVQELVACAFSHLDLDWREHVCVDPALKRGAEQLHDLVGDSSKARAELGWMPTISFDELVHLLVDAEVERLTAATASP